MRWISRIIIVSIISLLIIYGIGSYNKLFLISMEYNTTLAPARDNTDRFKAIQDSIANGDDKWFYKLSNQKLENIEHYYFLRKSYKIYNMNAQKIKNLSCKKIADTEVGKLGVIIQFKNISYVELSPLDSTVIECEALVRSNNINELKDKYKFNFTHN